MSKKLKVCLLWHNLNSSNYGVSALAVAQIGLILKAAKNCNVEVQIDTFGTNNLSNLKIKDEVEKRYNIKINHTNFSLKSFIFDILKFNYSSIKKLSSYDIVMDIGEGDSFTDIYGSLRFISLSVTKLIPILAKRKLILSPQTVGPFKKHWTQCVARFLINRADYVFSRDYKTTELLKSMKCEVVEVSDVAFTLEYDKKNKIKDSVGINISGLLWNGGYSGNNQFGLSLDYKLMIRNIISEFIKRGKTVHLVAHVIADDLEVEDDYRVCLQIENEFKGKVVCAPKFLSPIDAKSYMSQLEFFTGSRMHATIGSFSSSVVTVPIAYSRKFSGVFGGIGYNYTLNAYEYNTDELVAKLFYFYDNKFNDMKGELTSALYTAEQRNWIYLESLEKVIQNEIHK